MLYIKKISAVAALAFIALIPLSAKAATITLSPAHVSVHVGEAFTIAININSPGAMAYTIKADGLFTPKIVRLSTWNYYDAKWTALRQPGYDSFNNTLGTFVRTAGFAGGFTGTVSFAKATFIGGAVGKGSISLSPNTFIYNADNENIYTGASQVTVNVLPAAPKVPAAQNAVSTTSSAPASTSTQPSFDIILELQKTLLQPDEAVAVQVNLTHNYNVGGQLQVPVHYTLTKSDGTVVLDEQNVIALNGGSTTFTYQPAVHNLPPDTYTLTAQVDYPGALESPKAKAFFTIQAASTQAKQATSLNISSNIILILVAGIVCGFILIIMLEILKRRRSVPKHKKTKIKNMSSRLS